jgi:uncharacterized protein
MYLDVRNIRAEGLPVERTLKMGPLEEPGGESVEVEPVELEGRVQRLRLGFEFRGQLRTTVKAACSRCLKLLGLRLALSFDLIYREEPSDPATNPEFGSVDDPAVSHLDGGRIHLGRLVEEQVMLALPLKPLCGSDCRGLCPQCGARMEGEGCSCEPLVDPRLEPLRELKQRLEDG